MITTELLQNSLTGDILLKKKKRAFRLYRQKHYNNTYLQHQMGQALETLAPTDGS